MARYINKVQVLGNVGADPELRNFTNGGRVLTFSVATADQWTDRQSGERRERTTWHRIAIHVDGLIDVAEKYLQKGSRVLIEGKLEYKDYTDSDGVERTAVQIAIRPFAGELTLLDPPPASRSASAPRRARAPAGETPNGDLPKDDLDDTIPF